MPRDVPDPARVSTDRVPDRGVAPVRLPSGESRNPTVEGPALDEPVFFTSSLTENVAPWATLVGGGDTAPTTRLTLGGGPSTPSAAAATCSTIVWPTAAAP